MVWEDSCFRRNGMGGFLLPQEVWEDSCFRRNGMGGFLLPQEWYGRISASAGGMGGFLLPQEVWEDFCFRKWYGRISASASGMGGFLLPQEWYAEFQGWITVLRGRIQKYDPALGAGLPLGKEDRFEICLLVLILCFFRRCQAVPVRPVSWFSRPAGRRLPGAVWQGFVRGT